MVGGHKGPQPRQMPQSKYCNLTLLLPSCLLLGLNSERELGMEEFTQSTCGREEKGLGVGCQDRLNWD